MMKNYLELDLPFNFVQDNIALPNFDGAWKFHIVDPQQYLTNAALEFFAANGVPQVSCQFFRGDAGQSSSIHVDGRILNDGNLYVRREWAINIVWGSNSSEMFWYKPKHQDLSGAVGSTGVVHPVYEKEDVDIVDQLKISNQPVLCHIAIPHSVTNYDTVNYRWCMSIRAMDTDLSWPKAYKFFEQYASK